MGTLFESVKDNVFFVLQFLAINIAIFVIAALIQQWERRRAGTTGKIMTTRMIAVTGIFSAISAVLMLFELPVIFAPGFYKFDFSELPALIGAFAFGPVAGVLIEFIKIILKLMIKGTSTAFVGELANFIVGCSLVLPASVIYFSGKSKRSAIAGCVTGTIIMTVVGSAFNAIYLLPKFAQMYGMPLDAIVGMGTAVNSHITSVSTLVLFAVVPLNLLKGGVVSLITIFVYKKISRILKAS
ncbi:MAG: ECF transporter S component [Lachnospiraceae bacterium]|nr:ECF transporter S component [Lachnospiraceae bacterium]